MSLIQQKLEQAVDVVQGRRAIRSELTSVWEVWS